MVNQSVFYSHHSNNGLARTGLPREPEVSYRMFPYILFSANLRIKQAKYMRNWESCHNKEKKRRKRRRRKKLPSTWEIIIIIKLPSIRKSYCRMSYRQQIFGNKILLRPGFELATTMTSVVDTKTRAQLSLPCIVSYTYIEVDLTMATATAVHCYKGSEPVAQIVKCRYIYFLCVMIWRMSQLFTFLIL